MSTQTISPALTLSDDPRAAGIKAPHYAQADKPWITVVYSPGTIDVGSRCQLMDIVLNTDKGMHFELVKALPESVHSKCFLGSIGAFRATA